MVAEVDSNLATHLRQAEDGVVAGMPPPSVVADRAVAVLIEGRGVGWRMVHGNVGRIVTHRLDPI